tara:strand:- start:3063 stop:5390 length:2328 start_codon:yes stop_codon:yes gene_type:complete
VPLQKIQFRPGINRETTNYANEGGWYDSEKIRFRSGSPQKIGGWTSLSNPTVYTFKGVVRTLWVWVTLAFRNLMAVCTNQKVYIESGGSYNDITPLSVTRTLANNPIATVDTSKVVTITDSAHLLTVGTFVTFSGATAVGGLTIVGEYEIVTTPTGNTYTIASATAATSTSAGGGGAAVVAAYQYNAGYAVYTQGTGWGAGAWGRGTWGSASSVGVGLQLRLWSVDNFGQDLVLAAREGAPYYWTVDTSTFARAITLEAYANSQTKLTGVAATFGSGVTTITVPQSAIPYLTPGCVVTGTGLAGGQYITTAWDYSTSVPISAVTTLASAGTYTFSYPGRFVPNTTLQVMAAHSQRFIIMLGANPYSPTDFDTTFNPLLVRWSDQEIVSEWVPSTINQSGEFLLSAGSQIVTGRVARQENLVWTDAALYSMQYIGPPYVWSFNLLSDNISVASPNACIIINSITYWMGIDKFYVYTGRVETLKCTIRSFVFNNLNKSQAAQITCGSNEAWDEVWWFYPSLNSNVNDSYAIFNYSENIWYYGTLNRTAWLDSSLRDYPMGGYSTQNSYLGLDINSSIASISVVDGSSYPISGTLLIESEYITYTGLTNNTFTGCTRGALGSTAASHTTYTPVTAFPLNQILYHENGPDDAATSTPAAINSYIESSDFDIGDGHNFGFVWRMLPDVTFDGSNVNAPYLTLEVKPRRNSGTPYGTADMPGVTSANNYTSVKQYTIQEFTGQVYTRIRGRQMSFRIESDSAGTAWQLGAVRIDVRPDGRK